MRPALYEGRYSMGVPYTNAPRQKCDICFGVAPNWDWAVEVKLLRVLGDNGKVNDNIWMHIFSPYPRHRSALTDCSKLLASGLNGRKGILIYGFEHGDWPLGPGIEAFETLARTRVRLGVREESTFDGLIHPVHSRGYVFGWEIDVL